jgi:hypothetical protein
MFFLKAMPSGLPNAEPEIVAIFDNGKEGCRFIPPEEWKQELLAESRNIDREIEQEENSIYHEYEYEETGPER